MNIHYTAEYLLNATHPITIDLIGCGGTGVQVLNGLGRMHEALTKLGSLGLEVNVYDPDIVTEANAGRQLYSTSDIGQYKASIALTRINRFFGTQWTSYTEEYEFKPREMKNIIISCVDNIKTRVAIDTRIKLFDPKYFRYTVQSEVPFYWLDFGNSRETGQVVLGTMQQVEQPKSKHKTFSQLKTVIDLFPRIHEVKEDTEPSCSLAEALNKQDLFINSTLAQFGLDLIWKMLREASITYHGVFLNLQNFKTNPIQIK